MWSQWTTLSLMETSSRRRERCSHAKNHFQKLYDRTPTRLLWRISQYDLYPNWAHRPISTKSAACTLSETRKINVSTTCRTTASVKKSKNLWSLTSNIQSLRRQDQRCPIVFQRTPSPARVTRVPGGERNTRSKKNSCSMCKKDASTKSTNFSTENAMVDWLPMSMCLMLSPRPRHFTRLVFQTVLRWYRSYSIIRQIPTLRPSIKERLYISLVRRMGKTVKISYDCC